MICKTASTTTTEVKSTNQPQNGEKSIYAAAKRVTRLFSFVPCQNIIESVMFDGF